MNEKLAYLWGPLTAAGLIVAAIVAVVDQASKLWLLYVFDLGAKGQVHVAPFTDLVLTWNTGISYGWFQQDGPLGQWALLALKAIAVALLWIWLARAGTKLAAMGLGLIIGGALGNAIDRFVHGAVVDFVLHRPSREDRTRIRGTGIDRGTMPAKRGRDVLDCSVG